MTQNKNLIIAAAVAGLITGVSVNSFANEHEGKAAEAKAEKASCKGKMEDCKKEDGKGKCCAKGKKHHDKKDGKGSCGKAGCNGKMDDKKADAPKADAPKTEEHK